MMSTQWFDPIATLGYLAANTTRTRLMTQRVRRRVPAPARDREGVRDARPAVERAHDRRDRRRSRRGRVRRARRVRSRERGETTDARARRRSRTRSTNEWTTADGESASARVRCSNRTRRSGSADRASPRSGASRTLGDGWIPQATPPRPARPTTSRWILRERDRVRPARVPEIGYHLVAHVGEPVVGPPEGRDHGSRDAHRRLREHAARRDRRLAPAGPADGAVAATSCATRSPRSAPRSARTSTRRATL